MSDTQPLPEPTAQWAAAPVPAKRRSATPWIIAAIVVVVLAVAAWFIGEWVARDLVTKTIRDQVVTRLALPADQQVDVAIEGVVIPQLIAGELDDVTVSSDDVTLGELTGDITVEATGIPVRGDAPAEGGTASVTLDTDQLRTLLATVDGFPADTVGLAEPNVTMSTQLQFFGASFPVGVALTPSAEGGDIVLTPAALQLAGAEISADDLRDRFGGLADVVIRDWDVCIAQYIPSGITLTQVGVQGDTLVADLDIDGGIISDPALQANGVCA